MAVDRMNSGGAMLKFLPLLLLVVCFLWGRSGLLTWRRKRGTWYALSQLNWTIRVPTGGKAHSPRSLLRGKI